MVPRRRGRQPDDDVLLTWVVDPLSPVVRSDIGAVREVALEVHDEVQIEVVVTGDDDRTPRVAAAVVALLASGEVHPVRVVEDLVRAYNDAGLDISRPDVIEVIAERRGQDAEAVRLFAESETARELADEDRELARELGDPDDHSLVYWSGGSPTRLPGPGIGARDLVAALRAVRQGS